MSYTLGLKMKIVLTLFISALLITYLMLVPSSSDNLDDFDDETLDATITTNYSNVPETPRDKLIGGLLTEDFDQGSCLSRYQQSLLYRKASPYKPSPYLISKLRSYESLHKRCGPGTDAYKKATEILGRDETKSVGECKYVIWMAEFGLGNRMLTLASVFLYALLTERVVLVDQSKDINDLFCEPFPGTSWLLPNDFPLKDKLGSFDRSYKFCYGTMLKNNAINSTHPRRIPSHLYIDLLGDYNDYDKMFFCKNDQSLIKKVPWLVVKSNLYFVPALWLIPSLQTELSKLFPQTDTVFHHLSRYLFHPTNQVWGMVTRSYHAYLSRADERLGIQVRVFNEEKTYLQHIMDQIVTCTQREQLLPSTQEESQVKSSKVKAVLVTSLDSGYSDYLKSMYLEHQSSTGETVLIHQPSHEGFQQTDKKLHDQKALAEMYLLSLTDKIVTSAWSTFGYVAQGLGGLKPWILYMPQNHVTPDPPCVRDMSMEPCYHNPPGRTCKSKIDTGNIVPYVKHCHDMGWGIKLTETPDEY